MYVAYAVLHCGCLSQQKIDNMASVTTMSLLAVLSLRAHVLSLRAHPTKINLEQSMVLVLHTYGSLLSTFAQYEASHFPVSLFSPLNLRRAQQYAFFSLTAVLGTLPAKPIDAIV